jgi:NB-ARC domain
VHQPTKNNEGLFFVPYERNPVFTGREELIARLRTKLASSSAAALSQTEAISGLGGIGKTQTALEYAYRFRKDYTAVLWVTAETEQTLSAGFSAIAQLLQLPERDSPEQDEVRKAVLRWLESQEQWLVVFDNIDKPELLKAYLPRQYRGHVLLTSRARVFESAGLFLQPIALEKLRRSSHIQPKTSVKQ